MWARIEIRREKNQIHRGWLETKLAKLVLTWIWFLESWMEKAWKMFCWKWKWVKAHLIWILLKLPIFLIYKNNLRNIESSGLLPDYTWLAEANENSRKTWIQRCCSVKFKNLRFWCHGQRLQSSHWGQEMCHKVYKRRSGSFSLLRRLCSICQRGHVLPRQRFQFHRLPVSRKLPKVKTKNCIPENH